MHLSRQISLRSKRLHRGASVCFLLLLAADLCAYQEQSAGAEREAARLNNLGTALMSQQLLAPAAEKFSSAYELAPNLTIAKVNQGIALLYLQQLPEAQKALELAAAKTPGDPHAWYALGLLYHNQNEPQKAAAALQKVLAIDPSDPDTLYLLGSLQMELHDLSAAVADFQKALKVDPQHASAQFGLARALQRQGKVDEARAALGRFQHITSSHLGSPMSHIYGDEGKYGRVEDAADADAKVAAMIPVAFTEAWRSTPSTAAGARSVVSLFRQSQWCWRSNDRLNLFLAEACQVRRRPLAERDSSAVTGWLRSAL